MTVPNVVLAQEHLLWCCPNLVRYWIEVTQVTFRVLHIPIVFDSRPCILGEELYPPEVLFGYSRMLLYNIGYLHIPQNL